MNNYGLFSEGRQATLGGVVKLRKPYRRPELQVLGDLRTMTLGTSPTGIKDSGVGTLYEKTGDLLPAPGYPPPPGQPPLP